MSTSNRHLFAHLLVYAIVVCVAFDFSPLVSASTPTTSITTTSIPLGEVGVSYSQRLTSTCGASPCDWTTTSALPSGLTFSKVGLLSGSPKISFDGPFVAVVTDTSGSMTSATFVLDIAAGPTITSTTIYGAVLGKAYAVQLSASGGTAPYTWSVTGGAVPLGLVLNSRGLLSGLPAEAGQTVMTITVTDAVGSRETSPLSVVVGPSSAVPQSYLVASRTGAVSAFASPGVQVPQTAEYGPGHVVGIATDAIDDRYWLVTSSGRVTASPRTRSFGSVGPKHLLGHIVAIAATADGTGYWVASSTGHVYAFGSARSFGSVRPGNVVGHIVAITVTAGGTGYWLASSTGHVYRFGSARAFRERGRARINASVVGIASDPLSNGFWLVTRAGRVYAFGHAGIVGSIPARRHLRLVVGIAPSPSGTGYWLVASNGDVFSFGSAAHLRAVEVGAGSDQASAIVSAS